MFIYFDLLIKEPGGCKCKTCQIEDWVRSCRDEEEMGSLHQTIPEDWYEKVMDVRNFYGWWHQWQEKVQLSNYVHISMDNLRTLVFF